MPPPGSLPRKPWRKRRPGTPTRSPSTTPPMRNCRGCSPRRTGTATAHRQELNQRDQDLAEARAVQDRLQAALAEKEDREASLRQELEHLRGEAAARRQTEEVHARLEAVLREHERNAAEMRNEKEFVDGVIDGSPTGIFAHDRDGRCRVWNTALERILGRPRAEALGRTANELFPAMDMRQPHAVQPGEVFPNGSSGGQPMGVIGQSAMLETAHAVVRDCAGETIGGMALVRVLPLAVPQEAAPTPRTPRVRAGLNGRADRALAAAQLGDMEWLGFN